MTAPEITHSPFLNINTHMQQITLCFVKRLDFKKHFNSMFFKNVVLKAQIIINTYLLIKTVLL